MGPRPRKTIAAVFGSIGVGIASIWTGANWIAKFLGYSTVVEDAAGVPSKLEQILGLLLAAPWWLPSLVAVFCVVALVYFMFWIARDSPVPSDSRGEIDPWVASDTPTFVELHLTVDEFRCKEVSASNVFDTAVSLLGDDKTKLEIVIVFDRWIVSRDAAITCDNRLKDYRTSIQKMTDRYLICQVLNVGSPAVIRIDCN